MPEAALLPLATWQNFYVIVGTAAAMLRDLMFVVITLLAQIHISSPRSHITVFATSNIFHFGAVLLLYPQRCRCRDSNPQPLTGTCF